MNKADILYNEDRIYDGKTADYEEEQEIKYECDCCCGKIYEGETYYSVGSTGYRICDDCFETKLRMRTA